MTKAFEVFRKGRTPGRDIPRYRRAVEVLVEKLPTGAAYEWKRRGADTWRTSPSKPSLKATLLDKRLKVGEAFYARRKGGTAIFVLRAISVQEAGAPCPDPLATDGVKKLWDACQVATVQAEKRFGRKLDFVFMGIYNCRKIDGSLSWSQHAYRNALDFRIRRTGAEELSIDSQATTFVVNKVKDLAAEALWQQSGHYFHCHLTGKPKRFGTPECA